MERPQPSIEKRQAFMLRAADQLGATALQLIERGLTMERKPDGSKVTTADLALNQDFIDMTVAEFPGDHIWGEEGTRGEYGNLDDADKNWVWLIDPIDGTSGFWRCYRNGNFQECSSAIMLTAFAPGETTPTLSVVSNPFNQLPWTAFASPAGAFFGTSRSREFRRLQVPDHLPQHFNEVERYEENFWQGSVPDLRVWPDQLPFARKIRTSSIGVASVRFALGDIDLVGFPGPSHPHDIAPGALIVHRAGGTVTDLHGKEYDAIDWRRDPLNGVLNVSTPEMAHETLERLAA